MRSVLLVLVIRDSSHRDSSNALAGCETFSQFVRTSICKFLNSLIMHAENKYCMVRAELSQRIYLLLQLTAWMDLSVDYNRIDDSEEENGPYERPFPSLVYREWLASLRSGVVRCDYRGQAPCRCRGIYGPPYRAPGRLAHARPAWAPGTASTQPTLWYRVRGPRARECRLRGAVQNRHPASLCKITSSPGCRRRICAVATRGPGRRCPVPTQRSAHSRTHVARGRRELDMG